MHPARALYRDLNARAALYAQKHGLPHETTRSSIVFCAGNRTHGNFHPASWRAILADNEWTKRLGKTHTAHRRANKARADWHWRELDCAGSSDALLMNLFCHPRMDASALLGTSTGAKPSFGVHPRLPRERGLTDTTEIDMELDGMLFEAKLTESDFQTARPALLHRFQDWKEVFDDEALPRTATGAYASYQLLRGVLAAHTLGTSFCLLCDARRPDLIAAWHSVLLAVRSHTLRCRLKLLTWQELAAAAPRPLQTFLADKYGIASKQTWSTHASATPAFKFPASVSAA